MAGEGDPSPAEQKVVLGLFARLFSLIFLRKKAPGKHSPDARQVVGVAGY